MNILAALFFVSGATALIYQVLWTRLVTSMIGGSEYSIAIIVTTFMAGLGVGSKIAGSLSGRLQKASQALFLFAGAEALTALYALVLPRLASLALPGLSRLYAISVEAPHLYLAGAFGVCLLVIIPPVLLMGATLPLLSRAVAGDVSSARIRVPVLYGVNTLGAASGALAAGFYLVFSLGIQGTTYLAVTMNMAVAVISVLIARRMKTAHHVHDSRPERPNMEKRGLDETYQYHMGWVALVITFVSGFTALSVEVVWSKLFGLLAGPTTFSFSAVLFCYILSLGVGSLVAVVFTRSQKDILPVLLVLQLLISLFVLAASHLIGNSSLLFAKINYDFQYKPGLQEVIKLLAIMGFTFVPVMMMGLSFPLAFRVYSIAKRGVGESIGNIYAINTIGSVLGSGLTGFVLIPLLGMESSLAAVAAIQLGVTGVLALVHRTRKRLFKIALVTVALCGILVSQVYPSWNKAHLAEGKYHRFRELGLSLDELSYLQALWRGEEVLAERLIPPAVLFYGEGIGGFTTVLEEVDVLGNRRVYMANSGKVDASSHGDIYTQALLAHLPVMAKPDATNALSIGFGCGMTSGELLHYPGLTVDSVEISPQVVAGARYFDEWNNHVFDADRNRMIIQDARAHLGLGRTTYDIITSEPSNPWMAGLANLFTVEYLETLKSRLSTHGVFVQFLHTYQMDWETFALMTRTINAVFPNAIMFRPAFRGSDYALLCFNDENDRLKYENVEAALSHARSSRVITIALPEVIYPLIVTEDVGGLVGPGPVHTEDMPLLELWAPRSMYRDGNEINQRLEDHRVLSAESRRIMERFSGPAYQLAFAKYLASGNQFPFMVMDSKLPETFPDVWGEYLEQVRRYAEQNPVTDYDTIPDYLRRYVADIQEVLLLQHRARIIAEDHPNKRELSTIHATLVSLYKNTGRAAELIQALLHMIILNPDDWGLKVSLASLYFQQGAFASALELMDGIDQYPPEVVLLRAKCMLMLGQKTQADRFVREYISRVPDAAIEPAYLETVRQLEGSLSAAPE